MARIADYVATLSREERERFRDLIEECATREQAIQDSARTSHHALQRLVDEHVKLHQAIAELEATGERLKESVTRLYLRTLPQPTVLH